jgi:tRNA U34 5-methylaminomethyl-2-thiouridine-forming methyltransferase MnmC
VSVKQTPDGSVTYYSEKFKQTYHSIFGARTESERIFIELGLDYVAEDFTEVSILEIGWGTGLNALLTQKRAEELGVMVHYTGIEAYPLTSDQFIELPEDLQDLHTLSWGEWHAVSPHFRFSKQQTFLEDFKSVSPFKLIYFDAFSPDTQPEMWSEEVFRHMYTILEHKGVLTTYCSKVLVQKNLKAAGFTVEKHKGPPHKREVIRAIKKD